MHFLMLAVYDKLGFWLLIYLFTLVLGAAVVRFLAGDKKVNLLLAILAYGFGIGGAVALPWAIEPPSPWNVLAIIADISLIMTAAFIVLSEASRGHGFFADWRAEKES